MATLQGTSAIVYRTSPETVGWTNPESPVNHCPVLVGGLASDLDDSSNPLLHCVCHASLPCAAPDGASVPNVAAAARRGRMRATKRALSGSRRDSSGPLTKAHKVATREVYRRRVWLSAQSAACVDWHLELMWDACRCCVEGKVKTGWSTQHQAQAKLPQAQIAATTVLLSSEGECNKVCLERTKK